MLKKSVLVILLIGLNLGVAGCVSSKNDIHRNYGVVKSSYKKISPNDELFYKLKPRDRATVPVLKVAVAPEYPRSLMSLNLPPMDVAAQIIVDKNGNVIEVRPARYFGDNTYRKYFNDSVSRAVYKWKFTPYVVTTINHKNEQNNAKFSHHLPFSLWYMFHFKS